MEVARPDLFFRELFQDERKLIKLGLGVVASCVILFRSGTVAHVLGQNVSNTIYTNL
jgi:hypothetical protein